MCLEADYSDYGAFGYIGHETLVWFVLLAFIAGILGHTGLNYCLKYVSPLLISISVTLEPVLGSIIGWMFSQQGSWYVDVDRWPNLNAWNHIDSLW